MTDEKMEREKTMKTMVIKMVVVMVIFGGAFTLKNFTNFVDKAYGDGEAPTIDRAALVDEAVQLIGKVQEYERQRGALDAIIARTNISHSTRGLTMKEKHELIKSNAQVLLDKIEAFMRKVHDAHMVEIEATLRSKKESLTGDLRGQDELIEKEKCRVKVLVDYSPLLNAIIQANIEGSAPAAEGPMAAIVKLFDLQRSSLEHLYNKGDNELEIMNSIGERYCQLVGGQGNVPAEHAFVTFCESVRSLEILHSIGVTDEWYENFANGVETRFRYIWDSKTRHRLCNLLQLTSNHVKNRIALQRCLKERRQKHSPNTSCAEQPTFTTPNASARKSKGMGL